VTEDDDTSEDRPKRNWIPREAYRQEKAVVFARVAIIGPHKFVAHDRSRPKSSKEHLFQWKRGVRKATPDTELIWPMSRVAKFEFKSPGQKPDGDQLQMLEDYRLLGIEAAWGVTIEDLYNFWTLAGVPMVPNAHFLALKYDGMVDSRIAKAEARNVGTAALKVLARKAGPRFVAGKRLSRRIYAP
jgi:hypothetical protein